MIGAVELVWIQDAPGSPESKLPEHPPASKIGVTIEGEGEVVPIGCENHDKDQILTKLTLLK